MIEYMAHSGRKPHFWKIRKAWFRQFLITHHWGLRGAYSCKYFGGHEYMMTKAGEQGANYIVCIRRKEDFWAVISREDRDREAKEKRKALRCILNTAEDAYGGRLQEEFGGQTEFREWLPEQLPSEMEDKKLEQYGCIPAQTLEQIRQEIREAYPGIKDDELEAAGF